jgi:uncharacterized protein YfiM (DUF2279 family)
VQETVQIAMVVASRDEKTAIAETIGEYDMSKAKWVSKAVRGVCVVAVSTAAVFPVAAQAQDSWTSIDKANHFAYSAYLSSAAVKSHGNVVGIALALVPGVVKEMSDLGGSGVPSMRDMVWNVVGAVTGAVLPNGFLVVPTTNQNGFLLTYSGGF